MPYIGNTPALDYISFAVQNFTVTAATTVYTLDYSVSNENDIALYINNVAQRPGSSFAYSATGTTLTLTSATLATDTMYAVFIGRAVQTVTPPASSVTNTMLSPSVITGQTAETSVAGGDLVLIYDDSASALRKMTRTNFVSGIGGTNTPAFYATASATQSDFTTATEVKVNYAVEEIDTNSAFASSRFTVPSGQGGKYFIYGDLCWLAQGWAGQVILIIKKNGSQVAKTFGYKNNTEDSIPQCSGIFSLSAADYVEIFAYQSSGSTRSSYPDITYRFYGYKLIE
jgi:hypothetical protein